MVELCELSRLPSISPGFGVALRDTASSVIYPMTDSRQWVCHSRGEISHCQKNEGEKGSGLSTRPVHDGAVDAAMPHLNDLSSCIVICISHTLAMDDACTE